MVDGDDHRHAKPHDVLDMAAEIGATRHQRLDVLGAEIGFRDTAVHPQRPHGRHDDRRGRVKTRLAALDVEEFLRAEIGPEAGLGDHEIRELQRRARGDDGIAAMGDIGEGPAMDEGRRMFERLHQVRLHRILQENGHRAVGLEIAGVDWALVTPRADDDVSESALQIAEIARQAQDRHDFRGNRDVEPAFARKPVRRAAERGDDLAQRPVVHVDHPPPADPTHVDIELVAPVDVVVDQRREQVVGGGDGMKIASEMEVDVLHRHDLRPAAAGSSALDAEIRAQRGLAQADRGLLADPGEAVTETHGRGGLALTSRRRTDGGHQDQLAVGPVVERGDEIRGDFRFVVAEGENMLARNAEPGADLADRLLLRGARDLDVRPVFTHVFGLPRRMPPGEDLKRFAGECTTDPSAISCRL